MTRIGITMGDPAGVGPEILLRALEDEGVREGIRPVVFGDGLLLGQLADRFGCSREPDLIQVGELDPRELQVGVFTELSGRASMGYLEAGAQALEQGRIDALVTGPIHKRSLSLANATGPGQTEWLGERFKASPIMLLYGEKLRVLLATTHVPLGQVPRVLARIDLVEFVRRVAAELERFFFPQGPRLVMAALNPHGEENGMPGTEEQTILEPAVRRLRELGLNVSGPLSGDTVFAQAAAGRFDAVVALYHDQGLAPLKVLHFADAVNVTLGLGVIRTSPDHGVAYDIARQGKADPTSMKAAIRMAAYMAGKASP